MNKTIVLLVLALFTSAISYADDPLLSSAKGAKVYFITPVDGQSVSEQFKIQFGLKGMDVAPAGSKVKHSGHHHLLINKDISEIDLSKPLPATDQIKHFGGGQTETLLTLPKGKHSLQLLLGNHGHVAHSKPVMSEKIVITVE